MILLYINMINMAKLENWQLANFASGYEMLQLKFDKMDVVEEADHRVRPNIGRAGKKILGTVEGFVKPPTC